MKKTTTLKITAFIFIFLIIGLSRFLAQNETNNWFFGEFQGLNFSSGSPVPFTSLLVTNEGSTSASDPVSGDLLFYTDGATVWDRTNTIMPHGTGLFGTTSSTMSAIAIPQRATPIFIMYLLQTV